MLLSSFEKLKLWMDTGKNIFRDPYLKKARALHQQEFLKKTTRTEIINYLVQQTKAEKYLEIGVRNPDHNFNKINCAHKYSVDPGVEYELNPVDFKMTSDDFFTALDNGHLKLEKNIKFDVIFIDGLHISNQVDRDISNALNHISDNGFIILHDCNPPTEFHAREVFSFHNTPAADTWNGTTWKAFYKYRCNRNVSSACIDTDWGIGVITKKTIFNYLELDHNPFYEYLILEEHRKEMLNLMDYESFKKAVEKKD